MSSDKKDDFFSDREANPHDGGMHGDTEGGWPINSGPYLVFSDRSTYEGAEYGGAMVCMITDKGLDDLEASNDFKHVDEGEVSYVLLADLLHCWRAVHGPGTNGWGI